MTYLVDWIESEYGSKVVNRNIGVFASFWEASMFANMLTDCLKNDHKNSFAVFYDGTKDKDLQANEYGNFQLREYISKDYEGKLYY